MIKALVPIFAFVTSSSGCFIGFVAPAPVCCVTIVVVVNPGLFAPVGTLSVDMWSATQMDDAGASPERVEIPLSSLGTSFDLTPSRIGPGERFRIRLAGPNRDRCNMNSADTVRTAAQGRTVLSDLSWQTTARGCLTP